MNNKATKKIVKEYQLDSLNRTDGWRILCVIYATKDEDAIRQADHYLEKYWFNDYFILALYDGNRKVKQYK